MLRTCTVTLTCVDSVLELKVASCPDCATLCRVLSIHSLHSGSWHIQENAKPSRAYLALINKDEGFLEPSAFTLQASCFRAMSEEVGRGCDIFHKTYFAFCTW